MGQNKKLLTVSEMRCFKACPRKHYHRYIQLRRKHEDEEGNLYFGKAVHQVLADSRENPPAMLQAVANVTAGMTNPFEGAKAAAMLVGHHHRYGTGGLRTVAVNKKFQAPLINPATGKASRTYVIAGEMDAVMMSDGTCFPKGKYVVEDKTSSEDISPGSVYWRRLALDVQVSTYYHEEKDALGVLYNVLGKPKIRPLQVNKRRTVDETPEEYRERCGLKIAEDPDKYFQRHVVSRTKDDEYEAMHDAWGTAKMIRECEKTGMFPRNDNSCFNYHRECEYFGVCTGVEEIEDNLKFRTAKAKHEELEAS
jgi:hypothetical protein